MLKKRYIICVDDEQAILNQLSSQLALKFGSSHEIEIAESAEEALELVNELVATGGETVELVICDQIMPGMKGDHFLENLNRQFPDIRKILLTGQAGLESAIYAINHAALDKYVQKPWESEDLFLTIKTLLEQVQLKRTLAHYTRELEEKTKHLETLNRIGIELNSIQELEQVPAMILKAGEGFTHIRNIIFFFAGGSVPKPPLFMPAVSVAIVEALATRYRETLEATLTAGNPLSIDHGEPCEHFPEAMHREFPALRYSIWLPVATPEKYFGALCLFFNDPLPPSLTSTLSILANHFAAKLHSLELTSDKIQLAAARVAAESANRMKSTFLANMSHELRTPLNAIIGYSEMLQEDAEDGGTTEMIPDLKRIQAAGKHLLHLINDILDLSKVEAGKIELYFESLEVRPFIDDIVSTVQPLVEKNANHLVVTLSPGVGTIHSDVTRLRQCLFNLLSNACKFTREGRIGLNVERQIAANHDWISFAVTDSGIGMTEEQMSRIFVAFQQADQSTTRQFGGTGLGLTITRRLCRMMGGDVGVESEPGKGSTFTIRIPAMVNATSADAAGESHPLEPTTVAASTDSAQGATSCC